MDNVALSILITLSIAIGVTVYRRIVENDEDSHKTFGIAVVVGGLASAAALFVAGRTSTKPSVAVEPFVLDPPAIPVAGPSAPVTMPST